MRAQVDFSWLMWIVALAVLVVLVILITKGAQWSSSIDIGKSAFG